MAKQVTHKEALRRRKLPVESTGMRYVPGGLRSFDCGWRAVDVLRRQGKRVLVRQSTASHYVTPKGAARMCAGKERWFKVGEFDGWRAAS